MGSAVQLGVSFSGTQCFEHHGNTEGSFRVTDAYANCNINPKSQACYIFPLCIYQAHQCFMALSNNARS